MKKVLQYLLLVPALFLITFSSAQAADADADIATMAAIIMHLNHYPNSVDQDKLAAIEADRQASVGEKALANALKNMRHKVSGNDADQLRRLQSDAAASKQEKELATILLGIAHHPSASDKKKLKRLID